MYINKMLIGGIILGIIVTVLLFFATVGIAAAANDVSFGEQVVSWFGSAPIDTPIDEGIVDGAEDVVEQVTENATA